MEITSAFNTSPDFIHRFEFAKQEEEMMSAVYFSLTCTCSYSSYQNIRATESIAPERINIAL